MPLSVEDAPVDLHTSEDTFHNSRQTQMCKVYFIGIYFHKEPFPTPGLGRIHMSDIRLDASLLLRASATDLCRSNTLVIIIQTERSLFIAFPACSRHWCCPSVHSNKLNKWQWTDGPPWTSEKGYLHLWIFTISSLSITQRWQSRQADIR